jgi:tetratricopeptide (TPR) repeat protein
MDASEIDVLVQRLVANPHDQEALAYAHNAGNADPKSYAVFLEKVGNATPDPSYASHWLSEAANVWSVTLGDPHRAARVLMMAVDKDPTQETAAERLAQLYRDKGEHKALVALLERRAKALNPLAAQNPELRLHLAGIHEELGRLWTEPPLSTPKKGADNYRRAIELDNTSAYAVYALRELYKQSEQYAEALPLFAMEQAIVADVERKLALYRDEAEIRKVLGDRQGATQVLREARGIAQDDATLVQELAASILERMHAGEAVSHGERQEAADLFVSLAEMYPGEHGFAYSTAALDASPGHDRAMQLAGHYGRELGRSNEVYPRWQEYLQVNPGGAMGPDARRETGNPDMGSYAPPHRGPESLGPLPGPAESEGVTAEFRAEQIMRTLQEASALAARGQKPQALAKYKNVLATDPAHPEALAWVEDYLRQKRQYAELRDVLMQAARAPNASSETRKQQLLDVAGLCETQLRDLETAIQAWKQICSIDRSDATAREHLRRLLERGGRWDELAAILEQEAMSTTDSESKIALEKKLAQLHEVKRKDFVAAGEAWARLAAILTGDEAPIQTAVKLFEKGQRRDLACQVISECAAAVDDKSVRAALYQKMGELYEKGGELVEAGEAYVQAAESDGVSKMWEAAERSFVAGERWDRAAYVVGQRAELTTEAKGKAALLVKAATMLSRAGDEDSALVQVENASSLDPYNDDFAREVERRYTEATRFADLADFFAARSDKIDDKTKRQALRKRAAAIHADELGNAEVAREILLKALEDGDDADVLTKLADDADDRGDPEQAQEFLHRLFPLMKTTEDRVAVAMREGNLLADALDDPDGAIARFLMILDEIDPRNRAAVGRIAELEEKRGNHEQVSEALERELKMGIEQQDRLDIARRLAGLYEGPLDNPEGAIRVLDIVRALDTEDFEATARLEVLCEKVGDWPRVASLLASLIEIEGDEDELSQLTRKLAEILFSKLDRGDEALAALEGPADNGDAPCRDAYVELADKLGWKGIVASKLVEWHGESLPTPERNEALRDAFQRFLGVERFEDAAKVAVELARSKGADHELAQKLEEIALRLKDLEAMGIAHDLLARELSGAERAEELVRQAEILVKAGVDPVEAQQHGETGLSSVPPAQVEPLLARLAALVDTAGPIIDVYERQIGRCKAPPDKLAALARAAQVAARHEALDRAKSFYELAIPTGAPEETLLLLELSANQGDREQQGTSLRRTLAEALSGSGQSARDGGRTRGFLLRRAAQIAQRDLGDTDKAFEWLGDALIAHVDTESLDALEDLAGEVGDLKRAEASLGRALAEVFDGPLVRQLLARRVKIRRDDLGDKHGAADDLKKLHDLSPADTGVMEELSVLLTDLGDFRGMVHVLEDQILRHKDPSARAELARKVARLWEEQLKDPREAADAWRRVLRMKAGDADAQAGLDRAKTAMLNQREAEEAAPPLPVAPAAGGRDGSDEPPALPTDDPATEEEHEQIVGASEDDTGHETEAAGDEEVVPASIYDDETFDGTQQLKELSEDTDHSGVLASAAIENAHAHRKANGEESSELDDVLAVDDTDLVDEVDLVEELEEEPEPPRAPKR